MKIVLKKDIVLPSAAATVAVVTLTLKYIRHNKFLFHISHSWIVHKYSHVRVCFLHNPLVPAAIGPLCCVASSGETSRIAAGSEAIKLEGEDAASVLLWYVNV